MNHIRIMGMVINGKYGAYNIPGKTSVLNEFHFLVHAQIGSSVGSLMGVLDSIG